MRRGGARADCKGIRYRKNTKRDKSSENSKKNRYIKSTQGPITVLHLERSGAKIAKVRKFSTIIMHHW